MQCHRLSYSKLDFIISWIFREVTSPVLFAKALLRPQIKWKNGYYRLKWGGLAEVIKTPHSELPVSSGLVVGPELSSTDCNEFRIECSDLQPLTPSLGVNDGLLSQQSLNGQEVPLGRFDLLGRTKVRSCQRRRRSRLRIAVGTCDRARCHSAIPCCQFCPPFRTSSTGGPLATTWPLKAFHSSPKVNEIFSEALPSL